MCTAGVLTVTMKGTKSTAATEGLVQALYIRQEMSEPLRIARKSSTT